MTNNTTVANGTNNSDTIKTVPIDHTVRAIYGNAGNDLVSISGNYGILWSNSTLSGGAGNDSIYLYGAVDGIHPSTVSIAGGTGNDLVSIYGGYQGIHGGTVGMKSKSSVSVDLGSGNDTIFIQGREKGIDISNVKIKSDEGNDIISIYGGKYGIGGVSGYGNATVSIDGGSGADTIAISSIDTLSNVTLTAGANDVISVGSGSADYFFDSTSKVTINGAVFKANLANTSAKLKTASNSITLNSDFNGTIEIPNGIKFTDNTNTIGSDSSDDTIQPSGETSSLKNSSDNTTIYGTQGNDTNLRNIGDNVLVYGLAGDDYIYNYDGVGTNATIGNNVTIVGGEGNDIINGTNATSHIKYEWGDGDDTIYSYSNGGETIHLGSNAYFKDSEFKGSDLIVNVTDGSMTFKNIGIYNKAINLIDAKGTNFTIQGVKTLKPYNRTVSNDTTIYTQYHEGYYGESITGGNGSATLEIGDSLKKDSYGNISEVYIFGNNTAYVKSNNSGTPIAIYGTPSSEGGSYNKMQILSAVKLMFIEINQGELSLKRLIRANQLI